MTAVKMLFVLAAIGSQLVHSVCSFCPCPSPQRDNIQASSAFNNWAGILQPPLWGTELVFMLMGWAISLRMHTTEEI